MIYIPKTLDCIPNILMLLNNGIEFDRSLLQFKHKVSSVLNDNISDPPIEIILEKNHTSHIIRKEQKDFDQLLLIRKD